MQYDMIIVGGGLVGASLAIALQSTHLSIALIDARQETKLDPRLFALSASSCQFLKNLELWDQLTPFATPIHQVHVSRQGHFGSLRLNPADVGLKALGHVIPAQHIETILLSKLKQLTHVTLYQGATLTQLLVNDSTISLTIEDQQTHNLHAPMVIGADGTHSTVRSLLNIPTRIFNYQQSALVTRTCLQRSHHHIAYERFNDKGAIAMLPLSGNECATIWTADTPTIEQLMTLSDQAFLTHLQSEFGYRLGRFHSIVKRHVFPLQMLQVEKKVIPGILLLGNAAHTLHPIAAQGFNLALYEVAMLVDNIQEKIDKNGSFNREWLYESNEIAQKQQTTSVALSHRLAQLFLTRSSLVNMMLQLGMMGLDILNPVKKRLLQKILGRSTPTSRLLLSDDE